MRIQDLSSSDIEIIIDQFEDARYLRLKAKKIIRDIITKYDLNQVQIWGIANKNKIRLMRRYDESKNRRQNL